MCLIYTENEYYAQIPLGRSLTPSDILPPRGGGEALICDTAVPATLANWCNIWEKNELRSQTSFQDMIGSNKKTAHQGYLQTMIDCLHQASLHIF